MKKSPFLATAAMIALFAAGSAQAQFYVGAAGGKSKSDFHCGGDGGTVLARCDREGNTGKAWVGWQLAPHWSGELSYVSPGRTNTSFTTAGVLTDREIKPAYFGLGLAADAPLGEGPFGIVGRAGLAVSMSQATDTTGGASTKFSRDGAVNAYEGVGLTWAITQKAKLELDYEHTHSQVDLGGIKSANGVNMLMVGGSIAF